MTTALYIAGAKDSYPELRAAYKEKRFSGSLRDSETSINYEGKNITEYQPDYSYGPWSSRDSDDSADHTSKDADESRTFDNTAATTTTRDVSLYSNEKDDIDKLESRTRPSLAIYEAVSIHILPDQR